LRIGLSGEVQGEAGLRLKGILGLLAALAWFLTGLAGPRGIPDSRRRGAAHVVIILLIIIIVLLVLIFLSL